MSFTEHNVNGVIFDTAGTLSVGGVRHAFTTRHGGVSPAPFDSLNLASNRGDREENILENYRRLGAAVGFDASRAVGCRQIHSDLVRVAREEDAGKLRWDERPYDADALITNVPNLPLFAYGTDCCMITVYDPTSRSIAAIHAGWRGTASGIVLKALVTMMSLYGADPYTMRAAIGPAIGKCCFETDGDVADAFHELMDPAVDERIERCGDKYHIDLKSINRLWLLRSGLDPSRIDVHPDCTKCRPDRYWSHRGMGGERGGMAAVIVLTEDAL
ncbi:MAG: peptidoglycan editing factor PgeF [Oscillospiraceae bacterium]